MDESIEMADPEADQSLDETMARLFIYCTFRLNHITLISRISIYIISRPMYQLPRDKSCVAIRESEKWVYLPVCLCGTPAEWTLTPLSKS